MKIRNILIFGAVMSLLFGLAFALFMTYTYPKIRKEIIDISREIKSPPDTVIIKKARPKQRY